MRIAAVVLAMIGCSWLAGCEHEDPIRTYQAPKETRPDVPTWTVPAGWKSLPGQSMRFATFQVDPSDPQTVLTIIRLGPEAGEILPNINRWENQLGLPRSNADQLSKVMKQIEVEGVPMFLVDLKAPAQRTLAAIVPRPDKVWFFKLSGANDVVARQDDRFREFVKSVRFDGTGTVHQPSERMQTMPFAAQDGSARSAPLAAQDQPPETAPSAPVDATWTIPPGWTEQGPRPMRIATFRTADGPDAADLVVTKFAANSFGGMLDNINRWRGMVGLEPVKDEKEQPVEKITVGGHEGSQFDMTGPAKDGEPPRRLRLAMVRDGQTVWFFRLIGPADAVEQQLANFKTFLESVRFDSGR